SGRSDREPPGFGNEEIRADKGNDPDDTEKNQSHVPPGRTRLDRLPHSLEHAEPVRYPVSGRKCITARCDLCKGVSNFLLLRTGDRFFFVWRKLPERWHIDERGGCVVTSCPPLWGSTECWGFQDVLV